MVTKQEVKQHLALSLLKILPRNLLSRIVGILVSIPLPFPLNRLSVYLFASYYRINLDEAEKPWREYNSIQALFTRRLKAGARPIRHQFVHPVDARITSFGPIQSQQLVQAKGVTYSLDEFLGEKAQSFVGGFYITYYLCPTDYHRVHVPCDFRIERARMIPGDLWPVNDESVRKIPKLFAVNERVVAIGNEGSLAMVMVGATNVGKMTLSFMDGATNKGGKIIEKKFEKPHKIGVGEEFGVFNMGSTVILVLDASYSVGQIQPGPVKLGEPILEKVPEHEITH